MPHVTDNPAVLATVAAYLLVVAAAGYAVVAATLRPGVRHWTELAGLSFAAGAAVVPLAMFLLSVAGLKPGRAELAGLGLVTAAALAVLFARGRVVIATVPSPRRRTPDLVMALGGLAAVTVGFAVANVVAGATSPGLQDIDAFAIWAFKAKVAVLQPLRPLPSAFTDPGLSYSHQDYPLGFPLLVAGAYAAVGRVDVAAGKLVLIPIYLALVGVVYGGVRRYHRRGLAVTVTALVVAAPTLARNAQLSVAETPLVLMFAATASMLLRWVERRDRRDLLLAGGFAAAAAFTKNEGLGLLPIYAVAVAVVAGTSARDVRRARWRDAAAAGIVAAAVIGPWLAYRLWLPKTHEDYGAKLASGSAVLHGLPRLPYVLAHFLARPFDAKRSGLIGYVLLGSAAFGWAALGRPPARVLWGILVAQIGLYVATFVVTPWDPAELVPMIGDKLFAQATPVVALLVAVHLRAAGFDDDLLAAGRRPGRPAPPP